MKLMDHILTRAISGGSGGGSGGAPDTGVMAVVFDPNKEYEYFEEPGCYKIADFSPSYDDLIGAIAFFCFGNEGLMVGHSLMVVEEPEAGLAGCGLPEESGYFSEVPMLTSFYAENAMGVPPGLYIMPTAGRPDTPVFYIWQPK